MTVVMIVSEKIPTYFQDFPSPFWPWPWVKVTQTDMDWKALLLSTFVPSFMTVLFIVSEKMSMFEFFKIFHQPLWPWPWVKVTQSGMFWRVLPQSTIVPSFKTVLFIVSEKMSMFQFFHQTCNQEALGSNPPWENLYSPFLTWPRIWNCHRDGKTRKNAKIPKRPLLYTSAGLSLTRQPEKKLSCITRQPAQTLVVSANCKLHSNQTTFSSQIYYTDRRMVDYQTAKTTIFFLEIGCALLRPQRKNFSSAHTWTEQTWILWSIQTLN